MKKFFKKILFILLGSILLASIVYAQDLSSSLSGKILLQVESMGQAWYVHPDSGYRYYLGKPLDAFNLMRELGLGISEADYGRFHDKAPLRLAGRILLRVEVNGEAYYVHPSLLSLHYLGRPADALEIMRELGLGISHEDLIKIPVVASQTIAGEDEIAGIRTYVLNDILGPGSQATIKEIVKEGEFYRVVLGLTNGQQLIFYLSKEGHSYKPAVMKPGTIEEKINGEKEVVIDLFVMSHCPYGLQMEKGLIPALNLLGESIDFTLKFNDYAMHGQTELYEELRQYCIQKNEPSKLLDYLGCFTSSGDSDDCIIQASVNNSELNDCISATDNEYEVMKKYSDSSTWLNGRYPVFDLFKEDVLKYSVTGSPTLVINGNKVVSARDSASLLETICSYFKVMPSECTKELSNVTPAPGFGQGLSNSTGSCSN